MYGLELNVRAGQQNLGKTKFWVKQIFRLTNLQGLGEMFEGDYVDRCGEIFSLISMGGRADPRARTPIGVSGIYLGFLCKL